MERMKDGLPALRARSVASWRSWLGRRGRTTQGVWLIIYHKASPVPSVHFHEAVEHALCYGWVDSKAMKRDEESFYLKFTPRNPKSRWGPKNRARAERLTASGMMMPEGQRLIDIAKESGRWD